MDQDQERIVAIQRSFGVSHRVLLNPVPQARHRSHGYRTYDPQSTQKWMLRFCVLRYLSVACGVTNDMIPLTTSYVSVDVTFLIRRPSSHFVGGNRNNGIREQYKNVIPTTTGDIDNYVKFFLDAIDGIFYSNDRNVVRIRAAKLFCNGSRGRTIFNIRPYVIHTIEIDSEDDDGV